jgi:hypothetical protein
MPTILRVQELGVPEAALMNCDPLEVLLAARR